MSINFQGLYLQMLVEDINSKIQKLKEIGADIHDNEDFDWGIDYIYYSPANDKIIFKTKEVVNENYHDESEVN